MRRKYLIMLPVLVIAGVVAGISVFGMTNKPIPKGLTDKLEFVAYIPTGVYSFNQKDVSYSDDTKVLSMSIKSKQGVVITLNQQATPEAFQEAPDYYQNLIEKLRRDKTLSTKLGEVYITRPVELKGKQTAVINYRGTLMFAEPSRELDDNDWRKFFNSLEEVK